jgi:hypothetical protein
MAQLPLPMTFAALEAMSIRELKDLYDSLQTGPASRTATSILEEINRREQNRITNQIWWLTVVVTVCTLVQVFLALVPAFREISN